MINKLFGLVFILIFALLLVNLVFSNRMSTSGEEIEAVQMEIEKQQAENKALELEVTQLSSISGLLKRAENMGFVSSSQVLYLKGQLPVAMR